MEALPYILEICVGAVLVGLIVAWLGRSRIRARPASEAGLLVPPRAVLILGLIFMAIVLGFAGAAAIDSLAYGNDTTTWQVIAAFLGFALVPLYFVFAFFMYRCEVSAEGLRYSNFLGAKRFLRWAELHSVRYVDLMKDFRLETDSGKVARVSVMLMGLPEFARVLLQQNLPLRAIDAMTMGALEATAAGNPPSIWRRLA